MKKQLFWGILLLPIASMVFAANMGSEFLGIAHSENWYNVYEIDNHIYIYNLSYDWHGEHVFFKDSIPKSSISINEFGFPEAKILGKRLIFLHGGNRCAFMDRDIQWSSYHYDADIKFGRNSDGRDFPDRNESTSVWRKDKVSAYITDGHYDYETGYYDYMNNGVRLSASSNLKDRKFSYNIKNIESNFIHRSEYNDEYSLYNSLVIPWAEGESDDGKGVKIDVTFVPNEFSLQEHSEKQMCDSFVILNGYVDFFRMDLFKKNNRIKRMRIESTDSKNKFSFETELPDVADFVTIQLPRFCSSIRLTILETYKGTLYNDTCITGIMTVGRSCIPSAQKTSDQPVKSNPDHYANKLRCYDFRHKKSVRTPPEGI